MIKNLYFLLYLLPIGTLAQNKLQLEINNQNNDIEINQSNVVNFTSSDLELNGKDGTSLQETFIRFDNISLPSDARINNVYLVFYGAVRGTGESVIDISGEVGNSIPYTSSGLAIKNRNYTSQSIPWVTNGSIVNEQYTTPNLKLLVETMINGQSGPYNLSFRFKGNGQGYFNVKSFSAAKGLRPKLVIDYWSLEGEYQSTFVTNIDDAKETSTGVMNTTAAYLNLGGRTDGNLTAIRFQDVLIPREAEISDAYIEFYAYGTSPSGNINIFSEKGNAESYKTTSKNISARNYSIQSVDWDVNNWTTARELKRTPNLKSIIDENRLTGWSEGQSLAFLFKGNATNRPATVYSLDAAVAYKPRLVIKYKNNGNGASIDNAITDPALMTKLFINEVSSQGTKDQEEDWIELYNDHDQPLYIKEGIYLSDKKNNKTLSEIKNVIIPAKGFATFLATSNPEFINNELNFGLSSSGETIYLSRKVNNTIVDQDSFTFEMIPFDQSLGRFPNGSSQIVSFIQSSYNKSNELGNKKLFVKPNKERGVYEEGFSLSFDVPQDVKIRYTLDGKYPSETTGLIYSTPINIDKSSVIKYYAYDSNGNNSGVVAHTYVLKNNYNNENTSGGYRQWQYKSNITAEEYAKAMSQIPIVSVSSGIEHNANWAQASIEYIDNHIYNDRNNFFSNSMTKKFGQESIAFYNPNIKFKFNSDAGVKKADYPFFDQYPGDRYTTPSKIHTIELKQGQDNASRNVYNIGFMRWSEKITMNIQKEMQKYALDTRYVQLFINGKYRGLKTMRNDFKTNNVEEVFGDDDNNYTKVNLQDGYFTNGIVEAGDGNQNVWNNIRSFATAKNLQEFKKVADIDDLIKFQIMFMFIDTENEATVITHNTDPNVMKATFMINDTDGAFFGANTVSTSNITMTPRAMAGGGGNYKYKWQLTSSRNGPGGVFGQFMGSNTNATTGNLEFKTLVKDAVLKFIGPANGNFEGDPNAPLSVFNVQQKMKDNVEELDILYKVDAAYMGFTKNAYELWKTVDYPRILAQTPERVSFSLKKWLEYNMAHTLDYVRVENLDDLKENSIIRLNNPNNNTKVYYTLDGTDPMGNDGVISPNALEYVDGFNLASGNYKIMTRAFTSNNWGPILENKLSVKANSNASLVISGINYKPSTDGDAEFIILSNGGNQDLDLSNYSITDAIKYTFPSNTYLRKGSSILLAKNLNLIEGFDNLEKYQWTSGSLSNDGEPITFKDANNNVADYVKYLPNSPWPTEANGKGYYLQLINLNLDNELPESWEIQLINTNTPNVSAKSEKISAIEEQINQNINLYPNPISNELNIELVEDAELIIYNLTGQVVLNKTLGAGINKINSSNWSKGVYLLKIRNKNSESVYRIIKN